MYVKNILKNDINISNEKITCLALEFKTIERLLKGKKPPEEIIVKAKFKELKDLIFEILRIKKIKIVRIVYKKKILIACLNVSDLLKEIKFVKDFFKLSS